MSGFSVDPSVLSDASQQWREQSAQLTTAGKRVSSASVAGFSEAVSSTARSFTTSWAGIIAALSTSADDVSDRLDAGWMAYATTDMQAQETFESWLATKKP